MLIDNKKTARIGDILKCSIKGNSKLSIVSGLFSIYAFDALKKERSSTESANILLTRFNWNENKTCIKD